MNRTQLNEIIAVVDDAVSELGYICLEVDWLERERSLRIYLDWRDAGDENRVFTIDDCLRGTHVLNEIERLDELVSGSAYHLEVSSPGLERPLRRSVDFERFVGNIIEVKLSKPIGDRKHAKGRLLEVVKKGHMGCPDGIGDNARDLSRDSSSSIEVTMETPRGPWTFSLEALLRANLVYDWNQLN